MNTPAYRNPAYNSHGTIDCEINHPVYGWIPFTVDPTDTGAEFDVAILHADIIAADTAGTLKIAAYVAPVQTLAQQADALIAGGLTVASTATPALNGTYTVASGAPFGREDIATEAQFVSTFAEFTNGTTSLTWPLANGTFVTFPTTASFMGFAKAAAIFYAACQGVSATGQGSLPSASVTIP